MSDLSRHFRRLAKAVDQEHYALAQRKDDGQVAVNEFARLGSDLLELGLTVLGEVPELDLTAAEASVLAVRTSLGDRLADPPGPPAEPQRTTRVLRLGGLTVTVATERTDSVSSDEDTRQRGSPSRRELQAAQREPPMRPRLRNFAPRTKGMTGDRHFPPSTPPDLP